MAHNEVRKLEPITALNGKNSGASQSLRARCMVLREELSVQ